MSIERLPAREGARLLSKKLSAQRLGVHPASLMRNARVVPGHPQPLSYAGRIYFLEHEIDGLIDKLITQGRTTQGGDPERLAKMAAPEARRKVAKALKAPRARSGGRS